MQTSEAATIASIMFFLATMVVSHSPMQRQLQAADTQPRTAYIEQVEHVTAKAPVQATSSQQATSQPKQAMVAAAGGTKTKQPTTKATSTLATSSSDRMVVERPSGLYTGDPLPTATINSFARSAVVNIFCNSNTGAFGPVTGSGVVISPDGLILTNAHVAQYVFLAQVGIADITCVARSGSPAVTIGTLNTAYLPLPWVLKNAKLIQTTRPTGTGQYDFALIALARPPASPLPHISPDVRQKAAFEGDQVLLASYPAEFLGPTVTQSDLYAVSSVTRVTQMLTFEGKTVDAFALGSVIGAQGGSSGGAVVNGWNRLVGLITTTSAGDTTAQRELHAISLFHVQDALSRETGKDLSDWIQNGRTYAQNFIATNAAAIVTEYEKAIDSVQNN